MWDIPSQTHPLSVQQEMWVMLSFTKVGTSWAVSKAVRDTKGGTFWLVKDEALEPKGT